MRLNLEREQLARLSASSANKWTRRGSRVASKLLALRLHAIENCNRDLGALESSIAQPKMTFDGVELYSSIAEKAAVLAHSLMQNHSFVDGNKRVGHAAMEVFLVLNGYEIEANVDEQEKLFLELADGQISRNELAEWLGRNIIERKN